MKLLKFNEAITFGTTGTIKEYAVSGWSLTEDNPTFTWTAEYEAKIEFSTQSTAAPIILRVGGLPFLAEGKITSQSVWVHLNGMYCGIFLADKPFDQAISVRNTWLEPRGNTLTFTFLHAKSPEELGLGADKRHLGIAVRSISLTNG